MLNLLSNAAKFTHEGQIEIKLASGEWRVASGEIVPAGDSYCS